MKILVVGGGAREHVLAWKLARERGVEAVVCAPGNPGMAGVARVVPVDMGRPEAVVALAEAEGVDLTVVGPEMPLSLGIADAFAGRGLPIAGPSQAAAELESSKAFAKDFMARHGDPHRGLPDVRVGRRRAGRHRGRRARLPAGGQGRRPGRWQGGRGG